MGNVVLDSSAILAILFMESDAENILKTIEKSYNIYLSAASYTETAIVFDKRQYPYKNHADLDRLIESLSAKIIPLDQLQAKTARETYQKYGKGNHPAKLNMGDCFAYALSKQLGFPLLYKGDDFTKTDVITAK